MGVRSGSNFVVGDERGVTGDVGGLRTRGGLYARRGRITQAVAVMIRGLHRGAEDAQYVNTDNYSVLVTVTGIDEICSFGHASFEIDVGQFLAMFSFPVFSRN